MAKVILVTGAQGAGKTQYINTMMKNNPLLSKIAEVSSMIELFNILEDNTEGVTMVETQMGISMLKHDLLVRRHYEKYPTRIHLLNHPNLEQVVTITNGRAEYLWRDEPE